MRAVTTPRVKICCIQSEEEAQLAIRYVASAIGLVSKMPSGPGVIMDDLIEKIALKIPPGITSVLLTCLQNSAEIIHQHKKCKTNAIQLVDRVSFSTLRELKTQLPGISIIQVVHVSNSDQSKRQSLLSLLLMLFY